MQRNKIFGDSLDTAVQVCGHRQDRKGNETLNARLISRVSTAIIPLTLVVGYETTMAGHLIFNNLRVCGIIVKYTNLLAMNHIRQEEGVAACKTVISG
ncbi:hypothetical protein ACROYT_G018095 [Oculina patagonica]